VLQKPVDVPLLFEALRGCFEKSSENVR